MKNEPLILEAEMVEKTGVARHLGIAFNHANMLKAVPAEVPPGAYEKAGAANGAQDQMGGAAVRDFLKATVSNVFLLGCLLGLFVLYCCSCVIHALTFPTRRKSS